MDERNESSETKLLYQIVEKDLRDQIISGALSDGDCLPRERELCARYGVSIVTVRKAVQNLADDHLLCKIRGKGTFVTSSQLHDRDRTEIVVDISDVLESKRSMSARMLACDLIEAPEKICRQLRIPKKSSVQRLRRLILIDGSPQAIAESYATEKQLPGLFDLLSDGMTLFQVLETRRGSSLLASDMMLRSSTATAEDARLLSYVAGAPTFSVSLLVLQSDAQPAIFSKTTWRADDISFRLKMSLDGMVL